MVVSKRTARALDSDADTYLQFYLSDYPRIFPAISQRASDESHYAGFGRLIAGVTLAPAGTESPGL